MHCIQWNCLTLVGTYALSKCIIYKSMLKYITKFQTKETNLRPLLFQRIIDNFLQLSTIRYFLFHETHEKSTNRTIIYRTCNKVRKEQRRHINNNKSALIYNMHLYFCFPWNLCFRQLLTLLINISLFYKY